jgi:hemerythrin superfamily protein
MHNQQHLHQQLNEGLEGGDLKRLVHGELHIDEFKSKLGRDEDVVVISFKVADKEPAEDLVSFCEKGYDFVIDADVSSGEMNDGAYIVFVEIERSRELPEQIMTLMNDLMNLTDQKISNWRVRYHKSTTDHELTEESLANIIPLTAEAYKAKYGNEEIDKLKAVAGVKVKTKAPKNDYTESLRAAAGII